MKTLLTKKNGIGVSIILAAIAIKLIGGNPSALLGWFIWGSIGLFIVKYVRDSFRMEKKELEQQRVKQEAKA